MNIMPIEVIKKIKVIVGNNFPLDYKVLSSEKFYNYLIEENRYGDRTREIATHFWWAVKRHFLYKMGELEKDEWYKGANDFKDFFNTKEILQLIPDEVSRIPSKDKKSYFFYTLDQMLNFLLKNYKDPDSRIYIQSLAREYYEDIPEIFRDDYFRERCKKYTKEEIENKIAEGCQSPEVESNVVEFQKTG